MKLLIFLNYHWHLFRSYLRLLPFRLLGLKTGARILAGSNLAFPWLKLKQIRLGDQVSLGRNTWFYIKVGSLAQISVGKGTHVGHNVTISANKGIQIGQNCVLSYNVSVIDHNHVFGRTIWPTAGKITVGKEIVIGDGCFLGCNAVVLGGVKLGKHCVVGANAVVTQSFPDYAVIAGVPARLLKKL